MIETEEQRRWWFATHPEYSWSHRRVNGGKTSESEKEANADKVGPRDVDEYVDNALQYESDKSVRALLESIKRNFGTDAELLKEQRNLKAWEKILEDGWGSVADGWGTPAGGYADGGLYISESPKMPTLDELSRWPGEMVGQFFRWLDTILQNNPLIIDPNALERHHQLIKKFAQYFMDCGLNVEEFVVIMQAADHRLKPDGLHTGRGRGGDWNTEWEEFINEWPDPDNSPQHQKRIRDKLEDMKKRYRINEKTILPPGKPRSR